MMNFSELDTKMRVYETKNERSFFPEEFLVIRLDGRGFSGLTDRLRFDKPFDKLFEALMDHTTKYLMNNTGLKFAYGYHESDEISLLLSSQDQNFERKERKLISVLASTAGAAFTQELTRHGYDQVGVFDGRVSVLPNVELVVDYFRWRQEDATRNALSGYAFWTLRQNGYNARQAALKLNGASRGDKNELLFQYGINFNEVPAWQKRGVGFRFDKVEKVGYNPITKENVPVVRNRLVQLEELPYGEQYDDLLIDILWRDLSHD
jgi:tRNA(His) guanylyltransferase